MPTYRAPVDDWSFILHDLLKVHAVSNIPGFADLTPEFTSEVLRTAAKFHEDVLHPINLAADQEGARLVDGAVRTPPGFREAWAQYRDAGWFRISLAESLGGIGLPPIMGVPISELRIATGHSFSMYSSFCAPSAQMLSVLGAPWMKEHVVGRIASGEWTATMCMTEPHAGTDLRQLSTRADPQPDGTWRINGQKIFISGGDHDLSDNIVHIVLAKVPDQDGKIPNSLSAVNVFLVSKRGIDTETGSLGGPNGVHVRSIEHKMGIEASATCVLEFEDAVAWRLASSERQGTSSNMAAMFLLMNYARVGTAVSGVAYAEIARQNAADYARERLSGRAPTGPRYPAKPADPIIVHPDIRRLLLESRAFTEGARAGAMRVALWQSMAEKSGDDKERELANDLIEALTPVMKAYFTDKGFEATVACQQALGGHGYIKDYGIEQFVRNARIGQLYEGANGIQAIDLLQRKLTAHGGRAGRSFLGAIDAFISAHAGNAALAEFTAPLTAARARVEQALNWLQERQADNPAAVLGGAYDFLTACGILFLGWTWAEIAAVVVDPAQCRFADPETCQRKLQLGRVWVQRQLPLIDGLCDRVASGNDALSAIPDDMI